MESDFVAADLNPGNIWDENVGDEQAEVRRKSSIVYLKYGKNQHFHF